MLRLPLSLVLTCLAVLALLTNPVAAAAAQAACAQPAPAAMAGMDDASAMATMPMASMDHAQAQPMADPCCDHAAKHKPGKDCAQICAVGCAIAAALPATPHTASLVTTPVVNVARPESAARAFDPSGLDRPPKFIA
jgi:uncharacterized protein involved in copper resistance